MDMRPATLNTSENARKYHFLLRKSMFVLRKNSTRPKPLLSSSNAGTPKLVPDPFRHELDAQCLAPLFAAQHPVKNDAGDENSGKQISQQAERQSHGKAFHRTRSKKKENGG